MLFKTWYQIHFLHYDYFKYVFLQHFKSQFSHNFEQQYLKFGNRSLIQPLEILPVKLIGTHSF